MPIYSHKLPIKSNMCSHGFPIVFRGFQLNFAPAPALRSEPDGKSTGTWPFRQHGVRVVTAVSLKKNGGFKHRKTRDFHHQK